MTSLANKRVLFFAPKFFGYEQCIVTKMEEMGAIVDRYDERPENSFRVKAAIRINRNLIRKTIDAYYSGILKLAAHVKYDFVFVVNLESMTPQIVDQLRSQQPQACFILYMWDSIKNKKPAQVAFSQFDWCYSFDKNDAEQFRNVQFRPLFFIDAYDKANWPGAEPEQIGVTFIGTVHSDRYNLVKQVKKQVEAHGSSTFFYMYFHNKILFYYKKLKDVRFYAARYKEFSFKPITAGQIIEKIKQSKAVLDIQHPNQTGLTMRTIEMLGAGKKVITTNDEVKTYDFYQPDNILVINRQNPLIDEAFLAKPYKQVNEQVRYKYSLEGWLKEIFKLD